MKNLSRSMALALLPLLLVLSSCSASAAAVQASSSQPESSLPSASQVTAGTALDTALAHAGCADFSAVSLEILELDGQTYYIQFTSGQGRYQYQISAATGEILTQTFSSQEVQDGQETPEIQEIQDTQDVSDAQGEEPSAGEDGRLTASQAEDAALEYAGVSRGQTTYIHSYPRYYHGALYAYRVEFGIVRTNYWYDVSVETGEVISSNSASH